MKRIFNLVILFIFCFVSMSCRIGQAAEPVVRVAVLKDVNDFVLALTGTYQIYDGKTKKLLEDGRTIRDSRVIFEGNKIHIGLRSFSTKRLRLVADKSVRLYHEKFSKQFRGTVDIIVHDDGSLLVINVLGMEDYIKGVLYHEITDRWPMEATKAQAVAARSYALYRLEISKKNEFDVTSDIYSQMYGGKSGEHYRTTLAVDRTHGEILQYKGKVLPAYFHSNSGGHTEDVREVWNHDLPPLHGVPSPYSKDGKNYQWKKNYKSSAVQEVLNKNGIKIGLIKDIAIVSRTSSGRVKELAITDRSGKTIKIEGKKFREFVGPNLIRSNLYDVEMKGYFFDLTGKGWGHGVGMCQWGAYGMAKHRSDYKEILNHYYPGAKIVRIE